MKKAVVGAMALILGATALVGCSKENVKVDDPAEEVGVVEEQESSGGDLVVEEEEVVDQQSAD